MAKTFVFINHFWLCGAVVSHSKSLSKWLQRNALKRYNKSKNSMFWPLQKMSTGQVHYKLPKIPNKTTLNQICMIFFLEKLVLQLFFIIYKILLYHFGTIIGHFSVILIHKWWLDNTFKCFIVSLGIYLNKILIETNILILVSYFVIPFGLLKMVF